MGMKTDSILVVWILLTLQQSINTASIRKGNGETYKLLGVSSPSILIGDNAIVRAGSNVEIICPVVVIPEENSLIKWELNRKRITFEGMNAVRRANIRRNTEITITIYNIRQSDAATYTCRLEYRTALGVRSNRAESTLQVWFAEECPSTEMGAKWDKTVTGRVTGTEAQLGQTLVASTGSELRITGTVREGTRPWYFNWFKNGVELIQGQDYSFEFSDTSDRATIIIHNFQSQDAGSYTAVVSNRYGQDTHSFNIIVQTIVSCNNDPLNTETTCTNCQPSQQLRQATLTVYAHSFGSNIQLTWFRIAKSNGQRESIGVQNIINGANQFIVPIEDLCDYTYEVVVTGQNTYTYQCSCATCIEPDGTTFECCSANQTLLTESDCGDDFYADIILLIDASAGMDTEHEFLRAFLPRFEGSLRDNCVGNSKINKNQYTAVAFGSQRSEGKENPYFVGPNLNRGDSTQNVYFTIDINDPSNVTNTISQLPAVGEREDGYAATNFSITFAQLRENSIRFAILVTDELRTFFYRSVEEIAESSTLFNNFADLGRALYVDIFKRNNIIPIQIIDVTLSSGTTQCLGVSSAETCFYRAPGSNEILRLENTQVVNTAPNNVLKSIHKDYLETALKAKGYVWDLKVIRQNQTVNWDAITNALTSEVLIRAAEELTQCRNCRCLPGGRQCTIVPVEDQARCKCDKNFPGNSPYCDCLVLPDARVDYCRCRYINSLSETTCLEIRTIDVRS